MRIGVLLILALFVIYNAYGQPLKVNWIFPAVKQDPVISLSNPEIIKRINLVILGDGYSYSEFTKFDGDVLNLVSKIFSVEPFINYREYFNVISVAVNSQESGVNHPQTSLDSRCKEYPSKAVRNYFNSRLDYGGTHRLIYVDSAKVEDALRAVGLSLICNQAIVLVNDPEYGGAGGKMAAVSTNSQSADIFVHEVGHSLFDLRDEYWVNSQSAIEAYNMTKVHNEYTVSWKNWLGINGVGMYEYYDSNNRPTGWYKPHQKCMMQFLGNKFCSVCREGIILGIHGVTDIIYYTLEPRNALYIENKNLYDIKKFPVQFDVLLNKPFPNTLRSFWKLNGDIIANQTSNIKIYENELKEGINELEFYVRDTSSFLKLEGKSSAIQKACTSRRSYILNYKATKSSFLFLFDLSGSMNEFGGSQTISKLEQAKVASKITLNRMQSNNIGSTDEVAVLGFAGDCTPDPTILVSDFETDFMLIQNRIEAMYAGGGTPLSEAIAAAQCKFSDHLLQSGLSKGKMIILSDGQATCDPIRPNGVYNSGKLGQQILAVSANQCNSSSYPIKYYTIGFNIAAGSPAERDLQFLASISGGKYLNVQNQTQLERAFRKFNRTYIPKPFPAIGNIPETSLQVFDKGVDEINAEDYREALNSCITFTDEQKSDCNGFYNLALMQEANDFYKKAIDSYEKYLALCPDVNDQAFVKDQIDFLNEEFKQFVLFQKEVIRSDLEYIKLHFDKIQNGQSVVLAEEFKGFLQEKGSYYYDLPELVDRQDRNFITSCKEVAKGLENCARLIRRNPNTWDRDSSPFLSMTFLNLELVIQNFKF